MLHAGERLDATRRGRMGAAYHGPHELLEDLRLVQDSLARAGALRAAYGELQNLIWQVETFGFHLAELEVRQHSSVHAKVLTEVLAQVPDVADPAAAAGDADLLDRLATDGWPDHVEPRSDLGHEVLNTLRVLGWLQERWGAHSCGRYVVSFSRNAADLAAVRALARLAQGDRPLRLDVVPLFETGEDLAHCTEVLDAWWQLGSTRAWVESNQPGARGDGRLLRLLQGRRTGQRHAGAVRRPGASGQVGRAESCDTDNFPRSWGIARSRRGTAAPRDPRPAAGLGQPPAQGDRAGRGGLRPLRPRHDRPAAPRADHLRRAARGVTGDREAQR